MDINSPEIGRTGVKHYFNKFIAEVVFVRHRHELVLLVWRLVGLSRGRGFDRISILRLSVIGKGREGDAITWACVDDVV